MHGITPWKVAVGLTAVALAAAGCSSADPVEPEKKDGSFIYTYTLRNGGINPLVFVAEDPEGNTTTLRKKFLYE